MVRRSEPVMANPRAPHPLDVDLVDFIDGSLDAADSRIVEEHLAACLACRIKRQRISQTPPIALVDLGRAEAPMFDLLEVEEADPAEARVGELWLTAADDAAMVLITKVRPNGWGVVVVPVVLDTETADSGALVLDETVSPLPVPIAVYDGMLNSLPTSALRGRIVPSRSDVNLLQLTESDPGVSRGSPLEGPADPRHEVRQFINDSVVSVDPPTAEPALRAPIRIIQPMDQATVDARFRELQRALYDLADTRVEPLYLSLPDMVPSGWEGIAQVSAFNQRVLLLFVEGGLPDDRGPARALCDRLNGSALAIHADITSPRVDVYSRLELSTNHSVESGDLITEPVMTGPVTEVLANYLRTMVDIPRVRRSSIARVGSVDPKEILRAQVDVALEMQVAAGRKAHIEPKILGFTSVEGIGPRLAEALRGAFTDRFDPAALLDPDWRDDT